MRNQNFSMASGDDIDLVITVRDSSGCEVVDLLGASAKWVLAETAGGRPRVSKAGTIADPATGVVTVSLQAADTEPLKGRFHHELQITDAIGRVSTVMTGQAVIVEDSAP